MQTWRSEGRTEGDSQGAEELAARVYQEEAATMMGEVVEGEEGLLPSLEAAAEGCPT